MSRSFDYSTDRKIMSFYQKKKRILWYKRLEADTAQKILFKIHYL